VEHRWIALIKDLSGRNSFISKQRVQEVMVDKGISVPINNFDDLDNELNEVLVRILSAMLGIAGKVVIIDLPQWAELYEDLDTVKKREFFINDAKDTFGMAMPEDRIIWLNPRLCKREYNVLITTIIHELLHVKFPTMKEDKIMDLERKYSGRYDYKRLDKKKEGLKKCQKTLRQ